MSSALMSAMMNTETGAVIGSAPLLPGRLLIVDDIADNRMVLTRRFERRGFVVEEASSGEEALTLISQREYDLVLLDVMMPDLDGVEVLRRLRADPKSANLPVIMVTARTASDDVVQALQVGADDYITKPVDFAVALARVNTQLTRRRAELEVLRTSAALKQTNEALEERVQERTRDLMRINQQLQEEVAQRQLSEEAIKFLAHHDALTGLPNRILFREKLSDAIAAIDNGDHVGLLFIDLDGFKAVNDTLGHSVGDNLLRDIGERLKKIVGDNNLVARLGGDEFAVLLSRIDAAENAQTFAREIVASVAGIVQVDSHEVNVGASVGIVTSDSNAADLEELLRDADLAMYRAKSEGRGTWRVYNSEMDASAQSRRQLELDLRRALSVGDFRVYFQPIVNLATMQVTSFEALIRWDHATRGLVPPTEFITVAEDTGLIVPLGEWVIREACCHAATWSEGVSVAVNLSPVQFARGNIVSTIVNALAVSRLRPDRLEIEITESALLERTEHTLNTLMQLRSLGIKISMDDFGTGYSSLSYLRSFKFDKIKIDRSFIQGLESDGENQAIVAAITSLGNRFGLQTTAEGVETSGQLDFVTREGCTEVQGRLFSMPVPANQVPKLLEEMERMSKSAIGVNAPETVQRLLAEFPLALTRSV